MSANEAKAEIIRLPDARAMAAEAARRFVALAAQATDERGRFTVTLAGGSTPAELYRLLAKPPYREQVDWGRTVIFFGDERCVPPDHPWSNYRAARETLLDQVPLSPANIHRIAGERTPTVAAADTARDLRRAFGLIGGARPRFDLVLLGMGDDGHTASLFPGMAALGERRRLVVATAAPGYAQPAVARITLTFPVLNAARAVIFLAAGANKAAAAHAVLACTQPSHPERSAAQPSHPERSAAQPSHPERSAAQPKDPPLPAGRVRPAQGHLIWLLDDAAATGLDC